MSKHPQNKTMLRATLFLLLGLTTWTGAADIRGATKSGACVNEGEIKTGNHCVLMKGKELKAERLRKK